MFFFFFNDTATTEIYTLSLHDALPIFSLDGARDAGAHGERRARGVDDRVNLPVGDVAALDRDGRVADLELHGLAPDRKSTRLNSSHGYISYAVFCLKKKKSTVAAP